MSLLAGTYAATTLHISDVPQASPVQMCVGRIRRHAHIPSGTREGYSMPSSRGSSRVGTVLGPYELRSLIGVGGMGEVYQA
ncbi:MAG: hypothetical protein QOE41_1995 [Mycobacterium sp.]|nr:hypothetical protein [Mycobacterium sp.]